MTPESKRLVQQSWNQVVLAPETVGRLFYHRLFELSPHLGVRLIPAEVAARRLLLLQALETLARAPERAPAEPWRAGTAASQAVQSVLEALLWMLERRLGRGFTPGVRGAWTELLRPHAAELARTALGDAAVRPLRPSQHARRLVSVGS